MYYDRMETLPHAISQGTITNYIGCCNMITTSVLKDHLSQIESMVTNLSFMCFLAPKVCAHLTSNFMEMSVQCQKLAIIVITSIRYAFIM